MDTPPTFRKAVTGDGMTNCRACHRSLIGRLALRPETGPLVDSIYHWLLRQRRLIEWELGRRGGSARPQGSSGARISATGTSPRFL
jgi:hypothetical protein